jgi:hypothetical protein
MSTKNRLNFVMGSRMMKLMPKKKLPAEALAYFAKMGRRGGLLGGKARAEKLTAEQRSESARKAVLVRWSKTKPS